MTDTELQLLTTTARQVVELSGNRNDMLIAFAAAILDLYRLLFDAGIDTKADALTRLNAQYDPIVQTIPGGCGSVALKWTIDSLESGKLDAATLLRAPPAGSA